jgi:hypothetical protein
MEVTYFINEDQIQVNPSPLWAGPAINARGEIVLNKYDQPLSVMQVSGKVNDHSHIKYMASETEGIVACIQLIKNGYLMEFNTSSCLEMDYCNDIVDIRFIAAGNSFKFKYSKGATLNRMDIFIPKASSLQLLNQTVMSLLIEKGHFVIQRKEMKTVSRKIESILNESEGDSSEEVISAQVEKLIQLLQRMCLADKLS